ncbi:MAG: flippase [Rhodocyclales bacterium GT-UBC]|nr:MAG: flippase [Rhodocyclales bacterium GT-UBC]
MLPQNHSPVLKNILWTLIDRAGKMLIAFSTGIIVARILAPETYGTLNLANAVVGVVSFLNLGAIEAIVILNLAREPESKEEILGSAVFLRLIGGGLTILTVLGITKLVDQYSSTIAIIAPILAITTLFNAMEIGEYWLRKVLASKYGVISRQIALLFGAGGRIWAALSDSPLIMLATVSAGEAMLICIGLALSLDKLHTPPWHWKISKQRCEQIFTNALPLLLASAAVGLYARIGIVILGNGQSTEAVGYLGVATIMAEATHALPAAIMSSLAPILLAKRSEREFEYHFKHWINRITWLGIATCLGLFVLAPGLLHLFFGTQYNGAISVFKILIWSALFVFISIVSEAWIVRHNLQRYQLPKTLLAAAFSIALNLKLSSSMGAEGTAIATVISYSVSAFWSNLIFRNTRPLFLLQLSSLFPLFPCKRKTIQDV